MPPSRANCAFSSPGIIFSTSPCAPWRIFALAFSPTGRTLAAAGIDVRTLATGEEVLVGPIHLLEVGSGQLIREITTPQGLAWSLAFSPDGRTLASGGGDANVLLWDVTGRAQRPNATLTAAELEKL